MVCILCNSSSFINVASASSIRNVYEDSGGGTLGDRIRSKSSIVRSRRDVENVEIEKNEGNSLRKLTLSQTNSQSNHPSTVRLNKRSLWASWHKPLEYKDTSNSRQKTGGKPGHPRLLLSRKKREGFFDLSNVPRMMAHMARGLDYGLGSMIHSMMHAGHQMASHFMGTRPPPAPPTIHNVHVSPSPSSGSGPYPNKAPEIIYGEWTPIGSSFKPKPRPVKPYQPPSTNHISSGPVKKPIFAKPRPVYPKPQPSRPALRPPIPYKPVAFPNPTPDEDSYGTPIEQPAEPITKPPYQTTFTPEEAKPAPFEQLVQPVSGKPLSGTFVESGESGHDHDHEKPVEAVHAVEDWSDDKEHIKPIVDKTLFYNDLLHHKFKKKHKDGRSPDHVAIKAKEHHRVEKSAPHLKPHEVHEVSSFDHFSKFPIFQSFPALSGAFQLHHLPPVPPVGRKKYRKRRKDVPILQRSRSPESFFHKIFS